MPRSREITSAEAFARLRDHPAAVLVDVRTHAEWTYVGMPDLSDIGKEPIFISWSSYPDGVRNQVFIDELGDAGVTADNEVLFICRSGARSRSATNAAVAAGFDAYNVSDGFEGPVDDSGHRNSVAGWRSAGLPWRQS